MSYSTYIRPRRHLTAQEEAVIEKHFIALGWNDTSLGEFATTIGYDGEKLCIEGFHSELDLDSDRRQAVVELKKIIPDAFWG